MRSLLLAMFGMALLHGVPACRDLRCNGRRISSHLDIISFCVPRGMQVAKNIGDHGDVHNQVTFHGQTLKMDSGFWYPAKSAEEFDGSWDMREWNSPEGSGRDYRRLGGGTASRYVTLVPNGWVEYSNAPADVARAFDRVLDSMCLRPLKKR